MFDTTTGKLLSGQDITASRVEQMFIGSVGGRFSPDGKYAAVFDRNATPFGAGRDNLSLLDLKTASDLVNVARSNVDLSTTALEQSTDRFQAGVDDNLPVVQAQSTLAQAQSQYVNSVRQFNQAKLGLARNLGIVDTQYKTYLQGGVPPDVKAAPSTQPQGGR